MIHYLNASNFVRKLSQNDSKIKDKNYLNTVMNEFNDRLLEIMDNLNFTNEYINNDDDNIIITGYQPFYTDKCPLRKLRYHCFKEGPHNAANYTLAFDTTNFYQISSNGNQSLYEKYILNQLMENGTIFSKSETNLFIFANSHVRQLYESLECMFWAKDVLTTEGNPNNPITVISQIGYKQLNYDQNITYIPCMATDHGESGNKFINDRSNGTFKTFGEFQTEYLMLEDTENNEYCADGKSVIKFNNDQSKIFFAFSHRQNPKSLIYEFETFSDIMNITLTEFIQDLDVIMLNAGNIPFYEYQTFISDFEEIDKHRIGKNKLIVLIVKQSYGQLLNQYHDMQQYLINEKGIPCIFIDILQIMNSVKMEDRLRFTADGHNTGGHFCMPSVPSHFMLFFIEMINKLME